MPRHRTFLFIHQNFPGQFLHLCRHLAQDNRVIFLSLKTPNRLSGVEVEAYALHREPDPRIHPYLSGSERGVLYGQAVARKLIQLRRQGIKPDLIVGHTGWGETLFVKDVFPDVPLLSYFEFFYSADGADVGFDPEFPSDPEVRFRLRIRNQAILSCLEATDRGLSPTLWQHSRLPEAYRPKVAVIHDGVDSDAVRPDREARLELPDGTVLDRSKAVVTYVARNLEPYRGFHVFMRAVASILESHPTAHIVIVGGDEVSYGQRLPNGESFRERALREVSPDPSRVHFTGKLPYNLYLRLLQISSAHVYLTYPFVLSWSMLEAMSAGCLLIASRTSPVEEVVQDGENGLLVDFFDPAGIAERVTEALREPARFEALQAAARRTVEERYDLKRVCLPAQLKLVRDMIG
ncbi:glycosyltransferase family 4 protein [Aureimonas sp. N4]|uniref:glycosyltransferase family 4 protein n=1 Tax=Aureimonas sp. N4 TaxID=1638165 RepID=UPI000780B834|nr:glycosyltransferase family 4 protein [Aureimonas sp. N4]